jgi:hypothetical protein
MTSRLFGDLLIRFVEVTGELVIGSGSASVISSVSLASSSNAVAVCRRARDAYEAIEEARRLRRETEKGKGRDDIMKVD